MEWRPSAELDALRLRAGVLASIRAFFAERGVMEVETPLLSQATSTAPYLESFKTVYRAPGEDAGKTLYLQSSPEFAMKRLLAAGSGAIYQICKAFRNGEAGRLHNPEFSLLEWYRPGFDLDALMDEVEALLLRLLPSQSTLRLSYAEVFERYLGLDPHRATVQALRDCFRRRQGAEPAGVKAEDRDAWLNLLLTHYIEPQLAAHGLVFIFDYPASQAMLARIRPGSPPLAERFEVYLQGVELANGFHELGDSAEQRRRFEADRSSRREAGLEDIAIDERLLAALAAGLPACSGVALGLDRLIMLVGSSHQLDEVISFPVDRA